MTYRVTSDGKTATYMVQVVINCQGSIQTHFTETFGTLPTATARTTSPHIYSSVYQYSPEGKEVHDGWYAVVANPRNCGRGAAQSTFTGGIVVNPSDLGNVRTSGDYWYNDRTDHTGDTHGGMLFVNCKNKGEIIYERTITDLCANIYMNFSAWFANAAVPSSTAPINTQFRILDQNGDEIQSARINVNNIKASDGWVHGSTAFFSGANTELTLQIINNGEAGVGNDILIDDILFTSCVPKLSIQAGLVVECGLDTELSVEHDGINTVFNGAPFYLWQQWNYTTGKWDDIADDPVPGSSSKKGSGWDKKYYEYATEYGGPNIPQFRVIMSSDISVARSVGQDIFPVCHNYAVTDIAFADCVCSAQSITHTSGNASQTVCEGSPISDVVYTYGGVKTKGADVIDLPAGLSYSVNPATKQLTISGTPTTTGTAKIFAVGLPGEACISDTLTFTVSFHPTITLTCPPTANVVACNGSHAGAVTLAAFVTQGGATNATGISFLDGTPSVVGCTETVVRTYTATLNLCERTCTQEIVRTVDTTGPTADALPELGPFACYSEIPVPDIDDVTNVSDNCGGTVTVSHLSDGANPGLNGTVIRTYRLEDSCGNFTDIFQNISIVQPAAPAIECYETATWNSVSCVWDVTGTQPVQPAIECYETATWNANICDWVINSTTTITPIFTAINSICQGEIINSLPTTSNNNITGSWLPAIDNTQTTTYTFTPDAGQCAEEITLEIVVNEKPTLTLSADRTEITCKEPTATITANASGGAIPYRYRINNADWSVNNNFSIETEMVVLIHIEDNNQCTANAQINISENKPSPIVSVKTIPAVCYPATIDLANAIVTSNASINKYFSTSNLSSELSSTIVQGVTNKTFYVAGFDMQKGCMGNATAIPVQINELNVQHIGDTIFCENNTVRLWARGMGEQANQYKYDFYRHGTNPSYLNANIGNKYVEMILPSSSTNNYILGVQNGACTYTQSVSVTTIPSPIIQVEESSKGVKTIVENETHPPYVYRYDYGNWQTSPWFHLHEKGTYNVTVANARGCETTIPFIVNRSLDIIPALFFSPNNDGVNDTWEIENIANYPHAIIEIYDRFSKLLITYKGNETGWDGMYRGYPMPMTDY